MPTDEILSHPILSGHSSKQVYHDSYKNAVFYVWYLNGKPGGKKLRTLIQPQESTGLIPENPTLQRWILEFEEQAAELDAEIQEKIREKEIQKKTEMLERHAELGKRMTEVARQYLEEHKDSLKPPAAVRLLVEGVEIERKSRGLPSLITAVNKADDEDIMNMINDILKEVEVLPSGEEEENESDSLSDLS
jgi:hypothetical protein